MRREMRPAPGKSLCVVYHNGEGTWIDPELNAYGWMCWSNGPGTTPASRPTASTPAVS
jgi:hypothetical protein